MSVTTGSQSSQENPGKGLSASVVVADKWDRPYSRELAAFPTPFVRASKFWPAVGRVDNVYGDRNLVCSCVGMEAYADGKS